jgi:predicted SnoaL-like aldol condensation-catalyzing enzyme
MKRLMLAAACAAMLVSSGCATMQAGGSHAKTTETRAIVTSFTDLFCWKGQVREAFMRHVREDYIQHNPVAQDGRDNAIRALEGFYGANPQMKCEVMRIIVDGDLAAVHTRIKLNPEHRGFAVVDILRVEGGMIAEHWDVIQPIPETSANPHPMF